VLALPRLDASGPEARTQNVVPADWQLRRLQRLVSGAWPARSEEVDKSDVILELIFVREVALPIKFDPPLEPGEVKIVWPTKKQMEEGLADLERCLPTWMASPALLVIKPELGLIVSVEQVLHDDTGFELTFRLVEALVAPSDFHPPEPIKLACIWNQPYMSIHPELINAPYSFYLHFGAEGLQRAREMHASLGAAATSKNPMLLGLLRSCFTPRL
jgi:hypothetical protein